MKNFIIVGTQRTGSSALAEFIGLHPKICCGGEFTLRLPKNNKITAAKRAFVGDFTLLTNEGKRTLNLTMIILQM